MNKPPKECRQAILKLLYSENSRDSTNSLNYEEISKKLNLPLQALKSEISYLEQKGLVVIAKRQFSNRIYHSIFLTASGVDAVEEDPITTDEGKIIPLGGVDFNEILVRLDTASYEFLLYLEYLGQEKHEKIKKSVLNVRNLVKKSGLLDKIQTEDLARSQQLSLILLNMTQVFTEEDMRTICFQLGIDYDDLPAQGKSNKIRELIKHLDHISNMPGLIEICKKLRPNTNWDSLK